jgi:hypothetical protein
MRLSILLCAVGCIPHFHNIETFNAIQVYQQEGSVPSCRQFYEGQQLPDGSVVDQINGTVVNIIVPNPQSAEGEQDISIPCLE